MGFQFTFYFKLLSLTAIVALGVVAFVWRWRSTLASQPFMLMMAAVAGYAVAAAMEAASVGLGAKVFWSTLEYVGSGSVVTFYLMFAIAFTHPHKWLTRRRIAWLWILPILNVGLVATNHWHHLVWTGFVISPNNPALVIYQHGPGFFWVVGCAYLYVLPASILLIQAALRPGRLNRRQSIMLLLGASIPLLGNSLYVFKLAPPGLNITPMSFLLTGCVYLIHSPQCRLFDLVPVARDRLVERMSNGVLVLDIHNRVLDTNPAALALLGISQDCIGYPVEQVVPSWLGRVLAGWAPYATPAEETLDVVAQSRCIEVQITLLHNLAHKPSGRLVILRDITQRQQAANDLQQVNELLKQQLLEIQRLQTQLQYEASRDSLTGVFNRRYFEETLDREIARAERESYPITIILLDIDYFKQINDTYGHGGGDCVLQAFSNLLCIHTRAADIVCRYGGEEFVIALPTMALQTAYQRAEMIRSDFQNLLIDADGQSVSATVSGGVSAFPIHGQTRGALLLQADRALYAAKANGRNQIHLAG
jgi:diguanylate cyclase (GGDEF)-like protein